MLRDGRFSAELDARVVELVEEPGLRVEQTLLGRHAVLAYSRTGAPVTV